MTTLRRSLPLGRRACGIGLGVLCGRFLRGASCGHSRGLANGRPGAVCFRLGAVGAILLISLVFVSPASASPAVAPVQGPAFLRADTIRELEWHLAALRIPEVQATTKGRGVTVGLIDGGVDAGHPDLVGQILPGKGFGAFSGSDGLTDRDPTGHGTRMAGIIAAKGGSTEHALGIAPEAKILSVAISDYGSGPESAKNVGDAIRYAVDNGARVINMSFGTYYYTTLPPYMSAETDAIRYALDHDVVLVAAAGNIDQNNNRADATPVPAIIPGVIAVSSVLRDGRHDSRSTTGKAIALAAPGDQIAGPAPRALSANTYALSGESSSAAAIVSGVAALVRSRYPTMDAKNVINRLIRTASGGGQNRDETVGFGVVRPYNAVFNNVPTVSDWPLGYPSASTATSRPVAAPATGGPSLRAVGLIVVGLLALVAVAALVLIIVLVSRRSKAPAEYSAGQPAGTPGYPPGGQPVVQPGYPTGPPGYPSGPAGLAGPGYPGAAPGQPGAPSHPAAPGQPAHGRVPPGYGRPPPQPGPPSPGSQPSQGYPPPPGYPSRPQ